VEGHHWRPSERRQHTAHSSISVALSGVLLLASRVVQEEAAADIDWTFPLNFVEVVWSDGKRVDRQIIFRQRPFAVRNQAFRYSVRRNRQGLRTSCGVGFGRNLAIIQTARSARHCDD